MTETMNALSAEPDSRKAGLELGTEIRKAFNGEAADAVILFASAKHDYESLLQALAETCGTQTIVGASSAGEFCNQQRGEGYISLLAIRSKSIRFAVGIGCNVAQDPAAAARKATQGFKGLTTPPMPYRSALVMTDALAGHADTVVEELTMATGGNYRFFGGGAGDDGRFHRTHVFAGLQALSDCVVALEVLSMKPVGVGVSHGWIPASEGFRVTEAEGMRLISLNGAPAIDVLEEHARMSGQKFDHADPIPFFLHNVLGIKGADNYRLRVPLAVNADGSISCAADVPAGSIVHIMKTTAESAVHAAEEATRNALAALGGNQPSAALVFDCVATRLRLGNEFDNELKACADLLQPAGFVGCNTYGQIARAEGQFEGFHNCTAVVCVFPR